MPLFLIPGDIWRGFQSQDGSPCLCTSPRSDISRKYMCHALLFGECLTETATCIRFGKGWVEQLVNWLHLRISPFGSQHWLT